MVRALFDCIRLLPSRSKKEVHEGFIPRLLLKDHCSDLAKDDLILNLTQEDISYWIISYGVTRKNSFVAVRLNKRNKYDKKCMRHILP